MIKVIPVKTFRVEKLGCFAQVVIHLEKILVTQEGAHMRSRTEVLSTRTSWQELRLGKVESVCEVLTSKAVGNVGTHDQDLNSNFRFRAARRLR